MRRKNRIQRNTMPTTNRPHRPILQSTQTNRTQINSSICDYTHIKSKPFNTPIWHNTLSLPRTRRQRLLPTSRTRPHVIKNAGTHHKSKTNLRNMPSERTMPRVRASQRIIRHLGRHVRNRTPIRTHEQRTRIPTVENWIRTRNRKRQRHASTQKMERPKTQTKWNNSINRETKRKENNQKNSATNNSRHNLHRRTIRQTNPPIRIPNTRILSHEQRNRTI